MTNHLTPFIPLLAPALLFLFSFWILFKGGKESGIADKIVNYIALSGILISLVSVGIVYQNGTLQTKLLGWEGLGFALRLDTLSVLVFTMISIIGFVVIRFSKNYLAGDARKSVFLLRLAVTIASVELLVLSGNLAQLLFFWVATSFCLHYLLVFYRNRPQAIAAARKKFIVARLGDFSLLAGFGIIYAALGTGDLAVIFETVKNGVLPTNSIVVSSVFLVLAAVFKSAQFPTHGWLIEVVETPTPVSALLHAGLLNAGPFLMVRMSPWVVESTSASVMLLIIGGFTALYASVVFMTQPTIKVALGYSSIAHMGFSLLLCGLGVYSAAILHVVAHSFYKAHSFLSSGSVIDAVRSRKVRVSKRSGNIGLIALSVILAVAVYVGFCMLYGVNLQDDFGLMVIGAVIVLGLSQVLSSSIDSKSGIQTIAFSVGLSLFVALSFFSLEHISRIVLGDQIPMIVDLSFSVKLTAGIVLTLFGLAVFIQLLAPKLNESKIGYRLGIHLRNGLYVNVLFDRMIGSLKNEKFKWVNLTIEEAEKPAIGNSESGKNLVQEVSSKVLEKY